LRLSATALTTALLKKTAIRLLWITRLSPLYLFNVAQALARLGQTG
jgi:hypothetical protein